VNAPGYGAQGMAGRLRRVLVNRPGERFGAAHETEGAFYAEAVDLPRAQAQHDALVAVLEGSGAVVEYLGGEAGPDSIYTYDPALVCDGGALLLRSGKPIRRPEAPAMGEWFERRGIPVLARLEAPALADGGDLLWLDSRTLVIGRGFRTNEAGACAINSAVAPYVDAVHVVDLPIDRGADFCLHTLSLISMLDRDLAVVSLPLMPVHLYGLLRERGVELIEIAEEEWDSLAPNVLALGPRDVVMLAGNPRTSKRLRAAGCRVTEIEGSEVAIKGSGGPTCLTLPLQRDTV
jgi:N-dimethylarginine dimethylaminohydrolase